MEKCWFVLILNYVFIFSSLGGFLPVHTGNVEESIESNFPYGKGLIEIIASIIQNRLGNVSLDCRTQLELYANGLEARDEWALRSKFLVLFDCVLETNFIKVFLNPTLFFAILIFFLCAVVFEVPTLKILEKTPCRDKRFYQCFRIVCNKYYFCKCSPQLAI